MNIKEKVRLKLAKMFNINFAEIDTDKGKLQYEGEIAVGSEVYTLDTEGNVMIPENGEYLYEQKVLVIQEGVITEIKEQVEMSEETVNAVEEQVSESPDIKVLEDKVNTIAKDLLTEIETLKAELEGIKESLNASTTQTEELKKIIETTPVNLSAVSQTTIVDKTIPKGFETEFTYFKNKK